MDPQQRLLLEVAWEALEDAGQAPTRLGRQPHRRVRRDQQRSTTRSAVSTNPAARRVLAAPASAFSIAANRLSYVLGLQGPSLAVDTACSSSLVAVHLAVPEPAQRRVPHGACRRREPDRCRRRTRSGFRRLTCSRPTAAARRSTRAADGYVRGEGCGVVVLKRLSDALADGDRMLAVIRGTAVNQDGRSHGSDRAQSGRRRRR